MSRLERSRALRQDARVPPLFPDDPERRRKRDRVLLVLGLVLALFLVARAARKGDSVLVRNQEWGARFVAGQDPYAAPDRGGRLHGPYPPSYALVCAPLSLVPTLLARIAWATAQVAALAALFVLVRRWLARGWPSALPHASVLYAIGLVLAARYILRDTMGGGGNLLYATSLLWGIELALGGHVLVAAFLVALPLAAKPNLLPLVCVLGLRGRWRACAASLAALALLACLPAWWFGVAEWSHLWSRWMREVLAYASALDLSSAADVPAGFPIDDAGMNQSLRAALGRAASGWAGLFGGPAPFAGAAWIARVATAVALLSAAWACARARGPRAEILGILAFLPACLLASPITWKAHHAVLVGVFALLAASAYERGRWGRRAWFLFGYWIACGLLSGEVVGLSAKQWLQSVSIVTAFTVGLLALVIRDALSADCAAVKTLALERDAPDAPRSASVRE
jgi:hypothetical protein